MISYSFGLQAAIIGDGGFARAMQGGVIRIYSGSRPETANDAIPSGCVEIARITQDGLPFYLGGINGLLLDLFSPAIIEKKGDWILTGMATGVPTWFRWNWFGHDDNIYSDILPRLDGDVATTKGASGTGVLLLPIDEIVNGIKFSIGNFAMYMQGLLNE